MTTTPSPPIEELRLALDLIGPLPIDPASGNPALWVELDPNAERMKRRFAIYGTGHPIEGDGGHPSPLHVGSVIDGMFLWHIYELRGNPEDTSNAPD